MTETDTPNPDPHIAVSVAVPGGTPGAVIRIHTQPGYPHRWTADLYRPDGHRIYEGDELHPTPEDARRAVIEFMTEELMMYAATLRAMGKIPS